MNSVSFVGHLSKDVEVCYTQSGKAVAQFTIAVKRRFSKGTALRQTSSQS